MSEGNRRVGSEGVVQGYYSRENTGTLNKAKRRDTLRS